MQRHEIMREVERLLKPVFAAIHAPPSAQPSEDDVQDLAMALAWEHACATRQADRDREIPLEHWMQLDAWEQVGFTAAANAAIKRLGPAATDLTDIALAALGVGVREIKGTFILKADMGQKGNIVGEGPTLAAASQALRAALAANANPAQESHHG